MSASNVPKRSAEPRRSQFVIDHHYTVDELEWDRIVGSDGLGGRLLEAMAELSSDVFAFCDVRRVSMSRAERFEFRVEGVEQSVRFDYDVSPTSTLLHGLRHLFAEVNGGLRRAGVDWRFVLTRDRDRIRSFDYRLVLVPRAVALERKEDIDVVAGLDLKDFELNR